MSDLKPCPFCGGKVSIGLTVDKTYPDWANSWYIHGGPLEGDCSCRLFMESNWFWPEESDGAKEKEKLIERWNGRINSE